MLKVIDIFVLAVQVLSYGASAEATAVTAIFTKMLQHSLKNSQGLSQHPAATGLTQLPCRHAAYCALDNLQYSSWRYH